MPTAENQLLVSLPPPDRARLAAVGEPVALAWGQVLCEQGEATRHVHFPASGFVSLVRAVAGTPCLEVGMVGREGMLGVQLVLGVPLSPLRAVVQGEGMAWRVPADVFQRELSHSDALRGTMHRYLYVLMRQQASAAACLHFHQIGPRLARWLLMSQDRAGADRFHVTHELLASLLGVRRVGITMAAGDLQRRGLIAYHRGQLTVLDRAGLEAAACSCYATDCRAYAELMDTSRGQAAPPQPAP